MKIFVPGRICLFGEHSDWAGGYRRINTDIEKGYTLITGTNQGIHAEVAPHPTELVITSLMPDGKTVGPKTIPMDKRSLLKEAQEGGFFSYIAGVAYQIMTHYHVRGLRIHNFRTDLPVKKGLSSSAAICVLAARAFNRIKERCLPLNTQRLLRRSFLTSCKDIYLGTEVSDRHQIDHSIQNRRDLDEHNGGTVFEKSSNQTGKRGVFEKTQTAL